MAEDNDDDEARRREQEIARYRLAAEETLEQLEWCVNYLHRIRKRRIAEVIDNNRRGSCGTLEDVVGVEWCRRAAA